MKVVALTVLLIAATATNAAADRLAQRLLDTMDDAAGDLEEGVRAATFDLVDVRIEPRRKGGRLRIGGELPGLALRLDGDVVWRNHAARVSATLRLGIAGDVVTLRLPDFDVVPCSLAGHHYLELRLPLVEGRF